MNGRFFMFGILLGSMILSCGENSPVQEENHTDFSCAGTLCTTNDDCLCSADVCMPEKIRSMPEYGEINAGRCTRINCVVDDLSTCPEGYECWPLAMKEEFFPEGTETMCMKVPEKGDENESVDETADIMHDEDSDNFSPVQDEPVDNEQLAPDAETTDNESRETEAPDEDGEENTWPACYDQPCKSSDECCEGTSCLNKMAEMDPNINESEYCVVKDCKEGDDTTCPPAHTCLNSMMGNYCIKQ